MHDGLTGYKQLDCRHSLCNAHHLRELTLVHEREHIWDTLLVRGEALNPEARPSAAPRGTQGRHKQSKAFNLLRRLRVYRQDVWRFMTDENVPFTNNLAEQAPRMSKVRQKVSGCFRTQQGARTFFTIRSYLATMRKQHACLFECLISTFKAQPIQPQWAE